MTKVYYRTAVKLNKNMKKNICLLLIAALMCSCAGQDNGKDDFITISIDPEDSQIVSIADFFERLQLSRWKRMTLY